MLGVILGAAATRIDAPLTWWRTRLSSGPRSLLANLWPWSYAAALMDWLLVMPGTVLLDAFFGVGDLAFIVPVLSLIILSAFGLLLLTIVAGLARDARRRIGLLPEG